MWQFFSCFFGIEPCVIRPALLEENAAAMSDELVSHQIGWLLMPCLAPNFSFTNLFVSVLFKDVTRFLNFCANAGAVVFHRELVEVCSTKFASAV